MDTCYECIVAVGTAFLLCHSRLPNVKMLFHPRISNKTRSRWNPLSLQGSNPLRIDWGPPYAATLFPPALHLLLLPRNPQKRP